MTYDELHAIATHRGTVRWNKSGTIEHLGLSRKDGATIIARIVKQTRFHVIRRPPKTLEEGRVWTYDCVEVDSVTKEPLPQSSACRVE